MGKGVQNGGNPSIEKKKMSLSGTVALGISFLASPFLSLLDSAGWSRGRWNGTGVVGALGSSERSRR